MRTYLAALSRAHNLLEQLLEATIIETGLSASELLVMQVAFEADEPSIGVILRSTGLRPIDALQPAEAPPATGLHPAGVRKS